MTATFAPSERPLASQPASGSKAMKRTGWVLSGLVLLFLLFDAFGKLILMPQVIEATQQIGYPEDLLRPLGIIILLCAALYAIPRTAVLGAILLTGFLGGAVASHLRLEDPLFTHVLFGVYVGVLAWGGLYLRDERLRALIPLRRA
jgi:DoxX-like protein